MPLIRYPDGRVTCDVGVFWSGDYSNVMGGGAVTRGVLEALEALGARDMWFYLQQSDGDVTREQVETGLRRAGASAADVAAGRVVVGTVSQRTVDFPRMVLLPQDDGIFDNGLEHYFPRDQLPPWEARRSVVMWRGACSGFGHFLRKDVVERLMDHPACDVKLVRRWHEGKPIPPAYFGNMVPARAFLDHKYVLIVDGNGISSSHTWVFGSGAVPVMITNNDFWFKPWLVPYKNYVPVAYDLGDLTSVVDWLTSHDAEARAIAEGALELARTVFTPEFQRQYVREAVTRAVQ